MSLRQARRLPDNQPMKRFCVSVAFAIGLGAILSAQGSATPNSAQAGPDLSGRWTRESAGGGTDSGSSSLWGARVDISQLDTILTVRPASGAVERYSLTGAEAAEVLMVDGCKNVTRITKATPGRESVTITTWMVMKSGCVHGEFEDEPRVHQTGPIAVREVFGTRKPDSITVVSREGDVLTVETTRPSPGGGASTTTTRYRR